MIQTLCYIFCQSDFVCLLGICYLVHDDRHCVIDFVRVTLFACLVYVIWYMIQTLCYIFCQSDFVYLLSICYLVHDTDTVLHILS